MADKTKFIDINIKNKSKTVEEKMQFFNFEGERAKCNYAGSSVTATAPVI